MTDPDLRAEVVAAIIDSWQILGDPPPGYITVAKLSVAALQSVLSARGAKVVSPDEGPILDMVSAFWRVKNGHHYHDEPVPTDTSDMTAMRRALSAAPDLLSSEGV